MRPPATSRRQAFSLMEMIVVLIGLQVFLGITVGILWASIRMERAAAADFQQTLEHGLLADQFRADVAGAVSAPKEAAGAAAGPRRLILRQAEGKLIVYQWDGQRLERSESTGGRTSRQLLPVGEEQADVVFTKSANGRLITLQLTQTFGQGSARHAEKFEIAAALEGEMP